MKKTKFFLALPIMLMLVGCSNVLTYSNGETRYNKTTQKMTTTSQNETTRKRTRRTRKTNASSTTNQTTTNSRTTTRRTTTRRTTTNGITTKQHVSAVNKISFYVWNNEFQSRVNDFYPNVNYYDSSRTYLLDGSYIEWVATSNELGTYQSVVDQAFDNNLVDMFCFEADYAAKYVNHQDKIANLNSIYGLNTSKYYNYTKQIATDDNGELKGVAWQIVPGVITYNMNVAKTIFGEDVTYNTMKNKLSSKANFYETAEQIRNSSMNIPKVKYFTMAGPDCWYYTFTNNLNQKMFDDNGTETHNDDVITIDKNLFRWARDTRDFYNARYIKSVDDDYCLWGEAWGSEQGKDNCLCLFSCPWYNDFCLTGYRYNKGEDHIPVTARTDVNMRIVPTFDGWFWGGTWIGATKKALNNASIRSSIEDLLKTMTTDDDVMYNVTMNTYDCPNNSNILDEIGRDAYFNYNYFGGQNPFAVYELAVNAINLENKCDYDYLIVERFNLAFRDYFNGSETLQVVWNTIVQDLKIRVLLKSVEMPDSVTFSDDSIVINY